MSPRARRLALGAIAALAALAFLGAGVPKLLGLDTPGASAEDFARWGYPAWFRPLVGLVEVAGAGLLLVPRGRFLGAGLRFWGAGLLVLDMAGALGTHLVHGEAAAAMNPLMLLALVAPLAFAHRPAWLRRGPRAHDGVVA